MESVEWVKCPYCGNEFSVEIVAGTQFVYCYSDDGGCDKEFAIKAKISLTYDIYKLTPVTSDQE